MQQVLKCQRFMNDSECVSDLTAVRGCTLNQLPAREWNQLLAASSNKTEEFRISDFATISILERQRLRAMALNLDSTGLYLHKKPTKAVCLAPRSDFLMTKHAPCFVNSEVNSNQ